METRPAIRTTEFWLVVASNLFAVVQQAAGVFNIPDKWVFLAQLALNAAYAISRGIAKAGVPTTPSADDDLPLRVPVDESDAERHG